MSNFTTITKSPVTVIHNTGERSDCFFRVGVDVIHEEGEVNFDGLKVFCHNFQGRYIESEFKDQLELIEFPQYIEGLFKDTPTGQYDLIGGCTMSTTQCPHTLEWDSEVEYQTLKYKSALEP